MDLRRHRGAHNLLGTGQCRRLAKLVPNLAADNGTAALLNHPFVEWLAAPIIFPDDAVLARPLAPVPYLAQSLSCGIKHVLQHWLHKDAGGRYNILFPRTSMN